MPRPPASPAERERIAREFEELVNMSAGELRDWLVTDMSRAVGWKGADGSWSESVGHASGRQILSILLKQGRNLTADDFAQMRRTVGFVRRHVAQEPENMVTSRWRYSLMNWGHDPLKVAGEPDADGGPALAPREERQRRAAFHEGLRKP